MPRPAELRTDASLVTLNSFGVDAHAQELTTLRELAQLPEVLRWYRAGSPPQILGAGCNTLFAAPRIGRVLHVALTGRRIVDEAAGKPVIIEAAAGESWPELVEWTLAQGLYGLENLSLIPGSVGAAPIQNIGAYGVELAENFDSLEAVHPGSGEHRRFTRAECCFGYRDSVFKRDEHRHWLILSVRLALSRRFRARTEYGDIRRQLAEDQVRIVTPRALADAVIALRRARLPDPAVLGNAGSFFKNPLVSTAAADTLRQSYRDLPAWPAASRLAKLSAAWLIERDGWKGYRQGDAGIHERHALVLVNHGRATGAELLALAQAIQASVGSRFGVRLEPEPVIVAP